MFRSINDTEVISKKIISKEELKINSISKSYNKRKVVNKVSLKLNRGEAVGLLGPNGAGKTTCFYMIAGLVGLLMGGTQPVARATFSLFIPETKDTTSFFSFYDVTEKIGIFFGLLFYAFSAQLTGSVRFSVLIFMFFFFVGALLLIRVPRIDKSKLA